MSENKDLSKEYWSNESVNFTKICMAEYGSPLGDAIRDFMAGLLPEGPTNVSERRLNVLDVGCGTGFLTMLLCQLGCKVTAIDFAQGMIDLAEENCRNEGFDDVTFFNMDAQDLKFEDNTFDFAVVRNVVWMVPDAEKVYREMYRVLKTGGVLLNLDGDYGRGIRELENSDDINELTPEGQNEIHIRSEIASQLPVSFEDRPIWDVKVLWGCGAGEVRVIKDIEDYLDIAKYNKSSMHEQAIRARSQIFAVIAVKS